MIVTVEEMKNYLRVDHTDDDSLIEHMLESAQQMAMDVARTDSEEAFSETKNARIAVMYAAAYLYEHREEADHGELALTLRALLFGIREAAF